MHISTLTFQERSEHIGGGLDGDAAAAREMLNEIHYMMRCQLAFARGWPTDDCLPPESQWPKARPR